MADVTTRLPRGRHGLSRDEVVRTQRDRILLALAEAMAEKGYVATTVADVIRGAGVSRETFYQQFSSKLDAFTAAFDAAAELLFADALGAFAGADDDAAGAADGTVAGAGSTSPVAAAGPAAAAGTHPDAAVATVGTGSADGPADPTPIGRFEAAFGGYVDALAAQPAFARVFLVEVYAAGPEAIARRAALQQRVVDALVDLLDARTDRARFACEVLVAATGALVTVPLVAGDLDALRALKAPVIDLVRHALGSASASAE